MKMTEAFLTGMKTVFSNKKLWALLFGIQLLFAAIALSPIKAEFNDMLGNRLIGQELLEGNTGHVFVEFIIHHATALSLGMKVILMVGMLYLLATIFLNGGIIGCFIENRKFNAGAFFGDAGAFFGRFFRLFLFSLVFLLLAILLYVGFDKLLMLFKGDSEVALLILKVIGFIFLGFWILFIQMVFDYAKIRTVHEDRKGMFKTGLSAWVFVFKHLGKTLGLYYLISIVGLTLFLLFAMGSTFNPANTGITIFLLLLWQQLHSFLRIGVRMAFLASESSLYTFQAPIIKNRIDNASARISM
ncbi:hypothetical protein KAR48_08175 [bacterium]|nr:hypothetical protein [bacterium]